MKWILILISFHVDEINQGNFWTQKYINDNLIKIGSFDQKQSCLQAKQEFYSINVDDDILNTENFKKKSRQIFSKTKPESGLYSRRISLNPSSKIEIIKVIRLKFFPIKG